MQLDVNIAPQSLAEVPALVAGAEEMGFDALWTSEIQHDPFLPLALATEESESIGLGTAIAVAFARSPGALAYTAWDLAAASGGRFLLGLGTQVKPHVERRFGAPWPDSPVGQLREYVGALRAFWRAWQHGEPLDFRGEHYKLTLMTPFFNPGPIEHPEIPIYLAGVNPGLCRLAGEVAGGLHGHPLHTARHLREVVRPAMDEGALAAGREPAAVQLAVTAFVVTSAEEREQVRERISFYGSTPSYRPVFELHGWGEAAEGLSARAGRGGWQEMPALISDEMLAAFAVEAPTGELAAALRDRYGGLVDRITPHVPYRPGEREDFWRALAAGWSGG